MKYLSFLIVLVGLFGCTTAEKRTKPLIVCSTSIIASCVQEIVGPDYEVVALMGPEIDPHSYNPRPSDAILLEDADVIIYNGFHLEGKMAELFHNLDKRKTVISIAEYYPKEVRIVVDNQGAIDPHIWFDPPAWFAGLTGVEEELETKFPKDAKLFQRNLNAFGQQLSEQFQRLKTKLAEIPYEQRVIITSHDAFHYFSKAFHCQVKAIQGTSTTQDPSVKSLLQLQNYIIKHKIKALFVENSVNPKSISSLIENCSAQHHHVKIGGTLYSDALGSKRATTYIDMLNENVTTIYNALKP